MRHMSKPRILKNLIFTVAVLFCIPMQSLVNAQEITVKGKVHDNMGRPVSAPVIYNKRTWLGTFGNYDGTFSFKALKTDTLVFGAFGFQNQIRSFSDSVSKDVYEVNVWLKPLQVNVGVAEIIAPKDVMQIHRELRTLGYDEKDFRASGVDAFQSPITFLYEQFSRLEKSKRKAFELTYQEEKRDLLKALLARYVEFDIVSLSADQFDDFLDFCFIPDEMLKTMSQYDFAMYIKSRFRDYRKRAPTILEKDMDYQDTPLNREGE